MKLTEQVRRMVARRDTASNKEEQTTSRWHQWKQYWSQEWHTVSHKRLYVATAASVAVLFGGSYEAVAHIHTTSQWKQVFTDGAYVGMVPNDPDVVQAMQRIALGYHVDVRYHNVNTHVAPDYNWQQVASVPTKAVAITLNGLPLAYTKDKAAAQNVVASVAKALTPKGLRADQVAFVGHVDYQPAVVSAANVLSEASAVSLILRPTPQSLSGRGESLLAAVDKKISSDAQSALPPLLQVKAHKTVEKTISVPFDTKYIKDNHLGAGAVKVEKKGKPGKETEQIQLEYLNGKLVSQQVTAKKLVQKPVTRVARKGTNAGIAAGGWIWPSPSHLITSPFGYRSLGGGEYHPGMDIGCPIGTPIYATNNGVVEEAGWNSGGYGNWVKISNGNGIETVFGHMSRTAVHAGQTVYKGEIIGYSGATGNVTGPHLHYEVRKYGRAIQPLPYT